MAWRRGPGVLAARSGLGDTQDGRTVAQLGGGEVVAERRNFILLNHA